MCECNKPIPYTKKELIYQLIAAVVIGAVLALLHVDFSSMPPWTWLVGDT